MRLRLLTLVLGFSLFLFIFINISEDCIAADNDYIISIDNMSYTVLDTKNIGGRTWVSYNISIVLYNSGNLKSDEITVKIYDNLDNLSESKVINPGEYKIYYFLTNLVSGEHDLEIDYYPKLVDKRNEYNTGSSTFKIGAVASKENDDDNPIPGFEISLFIVIILFLILRKKKYF